MQRLCSVCGFPLGTRPGLIEENGVCGACINNETKKTIDFKARQEWLTKYIKDNRGDEYDCVIAVSGGKDSHAIVKRLFENHGVKKALLVSVTDEFTHTKAGIANIDNLTKRYNCDHITWRCNPTEFIKHTREDFEKELHPLKWIEEKIYSVPVEIAKNFGIKLVFFGENSAFEYGTSTELEIIKNTGLKCRNVKWDDEELSEEVEILYMGAIYPYSITDSLEQARSIGFKDLDDFNEWKRQGSIDQFTQIDSIAYIVHLFCKYAKFGFQRVADIACRYVREGKLTREQARALIDEHDHVCDPKAKEDFCRCINITENEFNFVVSHFANQDIVEYYDGAWHAKK